MRGDNSVLPSMNWEARGFKKPGPKTDPRREALMSAFGITRAVSNHLDEAQIQQLINCKDDDARRLLLKDR